MQALRGVSDICGIDGDELDGEGRAWRSVQVREREREREGEGMLVIPGHACHSQLCLGSFWYWC